MAIAAGGAAGALLRYSVSGWIQRRTGSPFPWGTVTVNVLGSFAMGFLWHWIEHHAVAPELRAFALVGLLGAFTTFSTFSLETVMLARLHDIRLAAANLVLSNLVCVSAALAGYGLARLAQAP